MTDLEILNKLLDDVHALTYEKKDDLNIVKGRASMIIRTIFGEKCPYIYKLDRITFWPLIYFGNNNDDFGYYFQIGVKQFSELINLTIEDLQLKELRKNQENTSPRLLNLPITKKIKEINVFVASPSDVQKERQIILEKLETHFRRQKYEELTGTRIIVNGWEELPSQTGKPQDIINKSLVNNAHIIIAVIRHKLGTPVIDKTTNTQRSLSGTVEEITFAIQRQQVNELPLGMIYFYKEPPSTNQPEIENEYKQVEEFRNYIQNEMLFKYYTNEEDLLDLICKDLSDNINNKINRLV